jgi:hypothetical protein
LTFGRPIWHTIKVGIASERHQHLTFLDDAAQRLTTPVVVMSYFISPPSVGEWGMNAVPAGLALPASPAAEAVN